MKKLTKIKQLVFGCPSEFGEAYNEFIKHGYEVTVASPKGGKAPVDPNSVSEDEPQEILDSKQYLEQDSLTLIRINQLRHMVQ